MFLFSCISEKFIETTQDYPDEMTSAVQVAQGDSSSGVLTYLLLFGFLFLLVIAVIIATIFISLSKRETRQPSLADATSKISELY